jgi:hypothetical protein
MNTKFQCRPTSALTTSSAAAGIKTKALQAGLIATMLLTLATLAAPARADTYRGEIRQDHRELRGDYRELAGDRADYRRAQASGDHAGMRRERMEIRQDKREIHRDRVELRHDVRDARHDRRHDHAGWQVPLHIQWHAVGSWQNHGHHFGW